MDEKRSLAGFVEGVAKLLREEVKAKSLRDRKTKILREDSDPAHKIEQIAILLRKQVRRVRKKSKS